MVYYLVYKASKDYRNRSLIPDRLRKIGCTQISGPFWELGEGTMPKVLRLLEDNKPIIMKRSREVKKRLIADNEVRDLGSLVAVAIRIPKDKKEVVRSFVSKAPCIRLCRRVYAFYQRHSQFDPENKLIDAQQLASFAKKHGGEVRLVPKLIILSKRSIQRLADETEIHLEKEILQMIPKCEYAYHRCLSRECSRRELFDVLRRLRRQFLKAKRKAKYYEKWMGLDFSRNLMRTYRALLKLKHLSTKQRLVA